VPADGQGRLDEGDEPVTVQAYDLAWPARFEDERGLPQPVRGEFISGDMHHVGSTAVPGLDAEPVIDMLADIGDLAAARPCISLRGGGPARRSRR
jgi:GrpB-like predicted nucleotidyltransferase (UPF0157 family)